MSTITRRPKRQKRSVHNRERRILNVARILCGEKPVDKIRLWRQTVCGMTNKNTFLENRRIREHEQKTVLSLMRTEALVTPNDIELEMITNSHDEFSKIHRQYEHPEEKKTDDMEQEYTEKLFIYDLENMVDETAKDTASSRKEIIGEHANLKKIILNPKSDDVSSETEAVECEGEEYLRLLETTRDENVTDEEIAELKTLYHTIKTGETTNPEVQ